MHTRWDDFAAALGALLEWLPADSRLIIDEKRSDGRLVQFAKFTYLLHAEVGGRPPPKGRLRKLLSPPSESERAEELAWELVGERLAGAGWSAPVPKEGHPNWWCELPASATRADYDALAAEVTRVFTAELRVAEPPDLQYTAWQEEPRRNGIPRFARDLELDSLGLTRFATP